MSDHLKQGLQAYKQTLQGSVSTEDLVKQHAPLVKRIALHLINRLPKTVQLEDLIQAGMIGLLEASQRFDPLQNASFETFAGTRIRGAMIDELRNNHWASRSTHQNIRKVSEAIRAIEKRKQGAATAQEIALELNVSIEDYYDVLNDISTNEWLNLDDVTEDRYSENEENTPESIVSKESLTKHLVDCLKNLPEREQLILSLYYNEEFNFKEIAKILDITEARVSQIHSQTIARLMSQVNR